MLDAGEFVEAKMYSGNVYGTSIAEIQQAHNDGKIALTDIEVQGVTEYKMISAKVNAVFVLPPSYETWQERLQSRYEGDVDPADMKKRLRTAKVELAEALSQDYYQFVINDDLETAVAVVDGIAHDTAPGQEAAKARQIAEDLKARL
jgi:guanylate kinase